MLKIREYQDSDKDSVINCLIEIQEYERALEPDRARGEDVAREMFQILLTHIAKKQGAIFIAELENEITGFISAHIENDPEQIIYYSQSNREWVFISDLVVLPKFRQKGIAKTLLKRVEQYATDNKIKNIKLTVLAKNTIAGSLYRQIGYRDYETTMVKDLAPTASSG